LEPSSTNFTVEELRCKCQHCLSEKPNKVDPAVLVFLQAIRDELDEPMSLSSAYRCELHNSEAVKVRPGTHNRGLAFDIRVPWGEKRMKIIELAVKHGFKGFGFANSFIHIDMGSDQFRSWGYN